MCLCALASTPLNSPSSSQLSPANTHHRFTVFPVCHHALSKITQKDLIKSRADTVDKKTTTKMYNYDVCMLDFDALFA